MLEKIAKDMHPTLDDDRYQIVTRHGKGLRSGDAKVLKVYSDEEIELEKKKREKKKELMFVLDFM